MRQYQHGHAAIVVHRMELSETERHKREEQILFALQQFGRELQTNTQGVEAR